MSGEKKSPHSYPAKLTAWLYERFEKLAQNSPPTVIIPTELIPENGKKLQEIIFKLIEYNSLKTDFKDWLIEKIIFCSSLVDRIVTGNPEKSVAEEMFAKLGFEDNLLLVTEPYKLWAIEGDARASPCTVMKMQLFCIVFCLRLNLCFVIFKTAFGLLAKVFFEF